MRPGTTLVYFIFLALFSPLRSESKNKFEPAYYKLINDQRIKVDSFNLEILPPSCGVQFYKEGIIFLSSSKSSGNIVPEHVSFGRRFTVYAKLYDSTVKDHKRFSTASDFPYPAEAITFSSDFKTMYFTKYSEDQKTEKIFMANFIPQSEDKEDWKEDENPLSFCTGNSVYTHPALSSDGKILIFSSNMPGSTGGMDLFISQRNNDSWSIPVSLGNAINSSDDELFPYLDRKNNLYFSSNGIPGFGGYDIFICKFQGDTWDAPVNLSTPVNTEFDDVSFKLSTDEISGFYTVKQKSGKKSLVLHRISMNANDGSGEATLSEYFTNPKTSNTFFFEPPVEATKRQDERYPMKFDSKIKVRDVIYRIQFLTSFNPKTRSQIEFNGKKYDVFEYLYSGAYRLCIGEFNTLSEASSLQNLILDDYPQAFIVAFKNNAVTLDPELFREVPDNRKVSILPMMAEQERLKIEKFRADSIETARALAVKAEAKRLETEKIRADSIATAKKKLSVQSASNIPLYRVQFASNTTKKGSYSINAGGKTYKTWEYFYSGAYRSTAGAFKTYKEALAFQNTMRKSGFTQAFVVAFRNNVRVTDPSLFK